MLHNGYNFVYPQASVELSHGPFEISAFELDSNTGPMRLQSVVFKSFPRTENEISIIQFILACSPFLSKLSIRECKFSHDARENTKMNWELAKKLLKFRRSSITSLIDLF